MIEIQTIRREGEVPTRQIIRIKGILPKDKLPPEYTSNKSGQPWAFWKETVDGKEMLVLRAFDQPTVHIITTTQAKLKAIGEGDIYPESMFEELVKFMNRAGDRLGNINIAKKHGQGIKETIRI